MSIFKQKAILSQECDYPRCEECEHYIQVGEYQVCNVPMIVSKQEKMNTDLLIARMCDRIKDLEDMVYSKI